MLPFTIVMLALAVLGLFLGRVNGAALGESLKSMEPPKSVVVPPRVFYFAATATDTNGAESDWSKELAWTNAVRARAVTLAWDASPSFGITNYTVYHGGASRCYTNSTLAGTNLSVTVRLARLLKTNRLVVVSSTSTGMYFGNTLTGAWTYTGSTNDLTINPAGERFYRAVPGGAVRVREVWF